MSGVLEGIRVLDWTQWQQGPVCSMTLGDMGADVIKIEERVGGDGARGMMAIAGAMVSDGLGSRNVYFEMANRNKRSITLDLKKEKAREIVHGLVVKSDVFIHNFRSSAVGKLELDYETLFRLNPSLVYANCSGWGPKGPDRDARAFDFAAMARSGYLNMVTEPGRPPWFPQGGLADQMGAITTTMGILAALVNRERTGLGQRVDSSILGGMSYLLAFSAGFYTIAGLRFRWQRRENAGNPLWNYYMCSDGRWIAMVMLTPDLYWPAFCRTLGIEAWEKDSRFDTMAARSANCEELIAILDEKFASRTSQEWAKLLRDNDLIFSVLNTIEEFTDDPQALANEYFTEFDHPTWGRTKMPGFPVGFSRTPCSVSGGAPELGQHTEEVLVDILGYTWEDIAILKKEEVI